MALPSVATFSSLAGGVAAPLRRPAPPVRFGWLPGGDLGVYWTLAEMRTVANAGVGLPLMRQAVRDAIGDATDPVDVWRGMRSWLATHTRFRYDRDDPVARRHPDLIEVVHTPLDQLQHIAADGVALGDCDDLATLAAAMAKTAGQRVRFVIVGFAGRAADYRHVFTELRTPGEWLDFDLQRTPASPMPSRRATLEV